MQLLLLLFIIHISWCYVIGIDFGSQFIKVAYQPFNRPPDIVLDPSGKRKIDNAVFFGEDQRVFGNNAEGSSILKPEYVYMGMNELLGEGGESNKPAAFQQRGFPYSFELTGRNTWALKLLPGSGFSDIPSVTVEEMNAMVLNYIISIVENEYGEKNQDVVLSIPSLFSQEQRQALLDAAHLANINVLAMIDQTTASAVTYAMTRHDQGVKRILFMDIGAHATEVSATQIEARTEDGVVKHSVVVLGKEVVDVGGEDFTSIVSGIIADAYEQAFKEDPRRDMKTMNRLRIQSRKYKEVLSANREVHVSEANLMNGHDIEFTLQRDEFEEEASSLIERILSPIVLLLQKLHLHSTDFDEVQIVGGSSRIPAIKSSLTALMNPTPIKANLNGDESAALGCVYYSSGSKYARNKLEHVYDLPYYTTYAMFYRPSIEAAEYMQMREDDYITANNGMVDNVPIFAGEYGYEKERSFSFPVRNNFRVAIGYQNQHNQKTHVLVEYQISDIPSIISRIENHVDSNVTLVFQLNEYGIVSLKKAELNSRYISQEDRIAYQRRFYNPFYSRYRDPRALTGRVQTNPLSITAITENVPVIPLSKADMKESKRKLKEMKYRDEKTKREQKILNQYESVLYDAELELEEESFAQLLTSEELEWLNQQLVTIKEYIQSVHDKRVLFNPTLIKGTVESVQKFLEDADKRMMEEL